MLCLLLRLFTVANTADPNDVAALGNLVFALVPPFTNSLTPCQQTGATCENGRVVALTITTTLPIFVFPDISRFQRLRNLTFGPGFNLPIASNFNKIQLLSSLENFAIAGSSPISKSDFANSILDVGDGLQWPNLHTFTITNARNLGTIPIAMEKWSKLRHFSVVTVDDSSSTNPLKLQTHLGHWDAIETFTIIGSTLAASHVPDLGLCANLTDFTIDGVTWVTTFGDPQLFLSPKLKNFIIRNGPQTAGLLPTTISLATRLETFTISNTIMHGDVTPSFRLRKKFLKSYTLHGDFGGILNSTIGEAESLENLDLITHVSGSLPSQLGILHHLTSLSIIGDPASHLSLTGAMPVEMFELIHQNLLRLTVRNMKSDGHVPDFALSDPVPDTKVIALVNDSLCATLPSWLIILAPTLIQCNFALNEFCFSPLPLSVSERSVCLFAITQTPTKCGSCSTCPSFDHCLDCAGALYGTSIYDICGVCNGDGMSCLDCNGVAHGTAVYDACEICGGTDACVDCAGDPFGLKEYDVCDVCNGAGLSCLDCRGMPFGTLRYDSCGVCGGDNLSCHDCAGVIGGTMEYDACGHCVDFANPTYRPSCYDCLGVPFGFATRDVCGVCHNASMIPHPTENLEDECDPDQIVAGVAGVDVIVPFDIAFGALLLILLLIYAIFRYRARTSLEPESTDRRFRGVVSGGDVGRAPPETSFPFGKLE